MHLYHWQVWCIYADIGCTCRQLSEDREVRSSQPQSNPISKARQSYQMYRLINLFAKYFKFRRFLFWIYQQRTLKNFWLCFFSHVCFEKTPDSSLANVWLIVWLFSPHVKSSWQCGNVKTLPRIPFWVTYSPVRTTQFWSGSLQSWENVKRRFWTISPNLGAAKDPEHWNEM